MNDLEELIEREGLKLASIRSRMLAYVIDDLLISLIVIAIVWEQITMAQSYDQIVMVMNEALFTILFLRFVYQAFFVFQYGATLGKMALKLRVVQVDILDRPQPLVAANRALFRIVSEMLFYFGFIMALADSSRQTLHDKTAKTLVVDAS